MLFGAAQELGPEHKTICALLEPQLVLQAGMFPPGFNQKKAVPPHRALASLKAKGPQKRRAKALERAAFVLIMVRPR